MIFALSSPNKRLTTNSGNGMNAGLHNAEAKADVNSWFVMICKNKISLWNYAFVLTGTWCLYIIESDSFSAV